MSFIFSYYAIMSMTRVGKDLSEIDLSWVCGSVFGEVTYEPGGRFGWRVQPNLQLVILDEGSVSITTGSRTLALKPGQVACQWPGEKELYEFDRQQTSRHRWIDLHPRPGSSFDLASLRSRIPAVAEETGQMRNIFAAAMTPSAPAASCQSATTALATAYWLSFSGHSLQGVSPNPAPLPSPLLSLQSVIADRFDQPLCLDDLADAASVTPSHLGRLCRKHLNTTPMRLLWDHRTRQGIQLLRQTGLGIAEIAYRVGFSSAFHFSRLVKNEAGHSPRAIRQQAWASSADSSFT